MQSRNHREGHYVGKWIGKHYRSFHRKGLDYEALFIEWCRKGK